MLYFDQIPVKSNIFKNIIAVSNNECTSLLLTSCGKVYLFQGGIINYNNLDNYLIPNIDNIRRIDVCSTYALLLDNKGKLYLYSLKNDIFKLTDPILINTEINIISITCGDYYSLCLSNKGDVYEFDPKTLNLIKTKLKNIVQISSKGPYVLLLTNNGQIYAYGMINYYLNRD